MSCGNDDSWVFAPVFLLLPISFILFCRLPPSYAFLAIRFLPLFHTLYAHTSLPEPFCVESLSGIFAEVSSFVLPLGPLCFPLWFLFDLVRRSARVGLSGFCFHHYGSGSFFLSSYWR